MWFLMPSAAVIYSVLTKRYAKEDGFSSALAAKRGRMLKLGFSFLLLSLLQLLPTDHQATFYNIASLRRQHSDMDLCRYIKNSLKLNS